MWLFQRSRRFDDLIRLFSKLHLSTISESTRVRYELDLERRILPYFRSCPLKKIDPFTIEKFRAGLLEDLSPKSVNNCLDLLGLILNKSVEWGLLEKSPMTIRRLKLPDIKYRWWEKKQDIEKFLREAKKTPYHGAYLLALECGLRLGEIVGLSKGDVDFKRCQLQIHRQWLEALNRMGPPKGGRQRFVPFSPKSELAKVLAKAIEDSSHEEAIFLSEVGTRVRATKLRAKVFSCLLKRAGVPRIRFHDLRHTFASWYMIQHDDIWSLKEILGHSDIGTTQRYAHFSSLYSHKKPLSWATA